MLNIIKNTINRVFASGVDSDASAFITATGLSGTTQKSAITTLVKDLKSSGLWSKMKAVYPMVTDNRNIFSYTEDFTNTVWQKSGISATGDTTTAPNGTLTADTIQNNNTSGYMRQVNLILSSGQYTQSAYFKKNNNDWVSVYTSDGGANYAIAYFNINTGVVGTVSAIGTFSAATSSIENVGSGWYRCSLTFTKPTTASTEVSTIIPDANNTFSRTIGQNTFIWGAQLEQSSTLSTYQPILTTPAAFMASQMKYNLKDARDLDAAFRLTWSGGWTYSATGATPNGTNAYADTKFNLSSNFGTREQSYSLYTQASNSNANVLAGVTDGSSPTQFYNGTGQFNILSTLYAKGSSFSNGYILMTSTLNVISAFEKVVKLGSTSGTTYSAVNYNYYIGARNNAGTADFFADRRYSFAHIGNSLTDQEALVLSQIVEKYQVALSRGVQAAQSFYYNSAYSNEANTYLYSTQITGTTQVSAINTLINGLKANNLWAKMKAVYPFVTDKTLQADMAAQMKFNLVNPQDSDAAFRLAFSGGWTYSTNGAQPNGTNGYADTKLGQTAAGMFANSHLSFYSRTNSTTATAQVEMGVGATVGGTFTNLLMRLDTSTNYIGGSVGSRNALSTSANSNGYVIVNALTAAAKAFKNGALIATDTATQTGALNTLPIYIGSQNNNSVAGQFSSRQAAFASIGDGLSDAEAALLYQLVQEYQTTLSRQV